VGDNLVYRCMVTGEPLDLITIQWRVRTSGSREMLIPEDSPLVRTMSDMSMITSTLIMEADSEPRCTATLDNDEDLSNSFSSFRELPSKHAICCPCCCMLDILY